MWSVGTRGIQTHNRWCFPAVVQPPTGVGLVSTGKSTAQVTWDAVSKVLQYQVMVTDEDNPSVAPVYRKTFHRSMVIGSLEPCSNYTVGVSSLNNFNKAGEAANVTHVTASELYRQDN